MSRRVQTVADIHAASAKIRLAKFFGPLGVLDDDRLLPTAALIDLLGLLERAARSGTREQIAALVDAHRAAGNLMAMNLDCLRGQFIGPSASQQASRVYWELHHLLAKLRRDASREFCKPLGLKDYGYGFGPADCSAQARDWCEGCGGECDVRHDEREHAHFDSYSKSHRTVATVVHTKHAFERCAAYAERFGFFVKPLDWSWRGARTAALFVESVTARRLKKKGVL